jgi:regulatory protein
LTRRPPTAPDGAADTGDVGRALGIAYRFINRRERSVAEVRSRLEKAEISEAEISATIDELTQFGYLDDARYAAVFTQDKRTLESWGNDRIARRLRERGVDRDLIEAALAEGGSRGEGGSSGEGDSFSDGGAGGELERAVALLRQRFPAGPSDQRDRERAFGVLARKGYDSELAAEAVRAWARHAAV